MGRIFESTKAMVKATSKNSIEACLDSVLGYLNFSTGSHDSRFFQNLNGIFCQFCKPDDLLSEMLLSNQHSVARSNKRANAETTIDELLDRNDPFEVGQFSWEFLESSCKQETWAKAYRMLSDRLNCLSENNDTYRDSSQAYKVLTFVFQGLLPAYLKFHRDQLFHQHTEFMFNGFFIARACETSLKNLDLVHADKVSEVLQQLNDHLGHRPVATLESQKIEPYPFEWIRPIPVYIKDAGAAAGPYAALVSRAVEIISQTSPDILRSARFDPEKLDELAIDPRAFDFDHPINKRPNHHFGTWDEQQIGIDGYYRRFIVHQVSLDGLCKRMQSELEKGEIPADELMTEAASVLACTMLMASAISGDSVSAWDSETTIETLLPKVAAYRDEFYRQLMHTLPAPHNQRLTTEASERHQPMGTARQALNANLSQRRASQLVNCRLASIFARMGFPVAAQLQLEAVPVAAARIICRIDCLLAASSNVIEQKNFDGALHAIDRMVELLKRGIRCGAIIDPWNILGFDANYSLFPALQNSVRDHRAFELVELVESILNLFSRLWSAAAAEDDQEMSAKVRSRFDEVVQWWRKYAAHEVMSVDAVDPVEIFEAAELVSTALNLWYKGGAAAGDIQFWAQHAELFDSPKAYKLVIDALMQRKDYRTSTALLIHWIGNSSSVGLQQGASSFHDLMYRWIVEQKQRLMERVTVDPAASESQAQEPQSQKPLDQTWKQIRRFHDFLEANAEHYWQVPEFQIGREFKSPQQSPDNPEQDSEDSGDLYGAAYGENFVYQDSTKDGFEGEVHDGGSSFGASDESLTAEVDRVLDRLEFLGTLASYWRIAATVPFSVTGSMAGETITDSVRDRLELRRQCAINWVNQATKNRQRLALLLDSINAYRLPQTLGDQDSMVNYDQHRLFKESLLEQTIRTNVETENAINALMAVVQAVDELLGEKSDVELLKNKQANYAQPFIETLTGIVLQDAKRIRNSFSELVECFSAQPVLYVPLVRGGDPHQIVSVRLVQSTLHELLQTLPQMGMFSETCILTQTVLHMEQNHPVALGAVTEFDELFKVAYCSMVSAMVDASHRMNESEEEKEEDNTLFRCLHLLTESMLGLWLRHSKTLRLSVVEKVHDDHRWKPLVDFVEKYGDGLLIQYFLHPGNIRAILHQGVENWIEQVENSGDTNGLKLFEDIEAGVISRPSAVTHLSLILEAIVENFNEYRDYNTTTTQSDQGDKLFILLDFLRLRTRYDRVCWKLKPVIWAHKILVDKNCSTVARMWRRSLNEKIAPKADHYLELLKKMRSQYSIRLESIGRRIEGRFESQIQIDRLIALVEPAVAKPPNRESRKAFDLLQHESQAFCRTTTGVGIDLPPWLAALEREVDQIFLPARLKQSTEATHWCCEQESNLIDLRDQLDDVAELFRPETEDKKSKG